MSEPADPTDPAEPPAPHRRWVDQLSMLLGPDTGQRLRRPKPLIRRRMPSGRGAMEQPNATGDDGVALTPTFWLAVIITGVAAGLAGMAMMYLLFHVQRLAFDYHHGTFEAAVEHSSWFRRIASLLIAGAFGGVAWSLLSRYTPGERSELDEALWNGDGSLSFRRCLGTSVLSEIVIGMGASLGREAAPKLLGAASGSAVAGLARLTPAQRRMLVACGGGAGLACVYNVPLGGALFSVEILYGSIALPAVLPALVCSFTATAVAWLYLPQHATYADIPAHPFVGSQLVWAVLVGPIIGVIAAGFIRLIGWVSHHRQTGWKGVAAPVIAFGVLAVIGLRYPQLFGNGKDMAHDVFLGGGGFALLFALFALKPFVTSLCIGSGASGGLFTPVMSTGAVLGGLAGMAWSLVWPGATVGSYAMIGAAAMIGAGMQAPLCALVLVLELTHSGFSVLVPMMAATALATLVSRSIDGYSIYTARLPGG
ncbi:MAG: chloride channel protein [Actinomycetota bacterium]|nr:chloride channel protein [Actinomycetota bacterium]